MAKKGLFPTHSGAVAKFLRGTHVVINARNEVCFFPQTHVVPSLIRSHVPIQSDVTPSLIMQRVEAASGARYSAHNEKPRKFEPIAPVGTNYTPIGKPDIAAMRRVPPAPASGASSRPPVVAAAKPSIPTASRPVFGAPVAAPVKTAPPSNVPDDDWGDELPAPPAPPPVASRPPAVPTAPRPTPAPVSIGTWHCVS